MLGFALENALHFLGPEPLDPFPYLRKREMLGLKSPDELEKIDMLRPVMSARAPRFRGRQETLLYIVANGPRADLCVITQLEDVDRFGFRNIEHDQY